MEGSLEMLCEDVSKIPKNLIGSEINCLLSDYLISLV